jgi:acetyl esterase/lipase
MPVLKPLETYGTFRAPRAGRCWLFDATNDCATLGARLIAGTPSALTVCGWFKKPSNPATVIRLVGECNDAAGAYRWQLNIDSTGKPIVVLPTTGTDYTIYSGQSLANNQWYHLCATLSGTTVKLFVDGSEVSTSTSVVGTGYTGTMANSSSAHFMLGASAYYNTVFSACDVRVYSVAKSSTEIAAICNQSATPETIDTTGLLAGYWCNEESGTVGYDFSGNGKNLTLTSIDQSTFHAVDAGVNRNAANWLGYTLSGSVIVPRNEVSIANAVTGSALGNTGRCPHPIIFETPCITGNGANVSVDLGDKWIPASADFTLSLIAKVGTGVKALVSQNASVNANTIDLYHDAGGIIYFYAGGANRVSTGTGTTGKWCSITLSRVGNLYTLTAVDLAAGTTYTNTGTYSTALPTVGNTTLLNDVFGAATDASIADLSITTGGVTTDFALQDGPGASNTNRNVAYTKSDGTGGIVTNAIVNGTVSTIWGTRCPGYVKDRCVQYGGRLTNQNLLTYSNDFSNPIWNAYEFSLAKNLAFGGVANAAWTLSGTDTLDEHYLQYAWNLTNAAVYRFAIRLKHISGSGLMRYTEDSDVIFDLANCSIIEDNVGGTTLVDIGGGWRLFSVSVTGFGGTSYATLAMLQDLGNSVFDAQDYAIGVYGAQLNSGAVLQAYEPTTATAIPADVFIAGLPSPSSLCADGLPKSIQPGMHRNKNAKLLPNSWNAPELVRIGYSTSVKLAPDDPVRTVDPDDSKYRRYTINGSDRFIATISPLSGSDKANAQKYVADEAVTGAVSGDNYVHLFASPRVSGSPLILYCHGATGDQNQVTDIDVIWESLNVLRSNGYAVASGYFGGDLWGNSAALDKLAALYASLVGSYSPSRVILWGVSMGGHLAQKALADSRFAAIKGAYLAMPVCNLATITSLSASIAAAYPGGTTGQSATDLAGSVFTDKRLRYVASAGDTVVPKASNTDAMRDKVAAHATEYGLVTATGDHGHASHFVASDILSFMDRCV